MNYSRQREALKKILRSTRSHPTAEWLYEEICREYPNTSKGTVYRNLAQLSSSGEILRLSIGDFSEHYDGFTEPHDHFVCTKCGAVIDVTAPVPDTLNYYVQESIGARVDRKALFFYGLCKKCLDTENQSV
ncbi:MAG: transcriptional repressor [bacterium]|nr:transcriptional repressor [bacterium]